MTIDVISENDRLTKLRKGAIELMVETQSSSFTDHNHRTMAEKKIGEEEIHSPNLAALIDGLGQAASTTTADDPALLKLGTQLMDMVMDGSIRNADHTQISAMMEAQQAFIHRDAEPPKPSHLGTETAKPLTIKDYGHSGKLKDDRTKSGERTIF